MRSTRFSAIALAALLVVTHASTVSAQGLGELYQSALSYDAAYLAARASSDSAQHRFAQSEALGRPSAALQANATTSSVNPTIGKSGDSNLVGATLSARYPLINRANGVTIDQARRALVLSQAELDAAGQDLIVRLSQAYFDVLAARDTLATTQSSKTAITEQLASAKRNFEVGTATITDTREAQARFDLATAQEIAAENELLTRRIALDQLVGRNGVKPHPPKVPVTLPALIPADAEAWVGTAEVQHPTIIRARAALDVATLEIDKAKAAERPTLDAVGSFGTTHTRGGVVSFPGQQTTATIGVQLNWPLYTGGATGSRIKETVALEEKSRNDLEAARRGVAQGTRVAYFGLLSGMAQVKALEAAESSSKLALEATQLGYKVGVRVNLDVLNAQTQLFQTQRDLAKSRYDVLLGGLKLRRAAGQVTPGDIEALDRLLAAP